MKEKIEEYEEKSLWYLHRSSCEYYEYGGKKSTEVQMGGGIIRVPTTNHDRCKKIDGACTIKKCPIKEEIMNKELEGSEKEKVPKEDGLVSYMSHLEAEVLRRNSE